MDSFTLIYIFTVFFISAFLKSLTGLGFSTICLGFLAAVLDIKLAILLVLIPSLSSNIIVMWQAGRFIEALKRFWPLYLSAIPGLLIGIWFLGSSDNQIPKAILGFVLILYGLWGLINGIMTLSQKQEKQLSTPIGFISGLTNGVTGSQIMPIMPYLLSLKLDRDLFVQTINTAFTINSLIMMAGLANLGVINAPMLTMSAAGILPVAVGVYLGGKIRQRLSDDSFRKMVLVLFILLGLNLFVRVFV